MRKLAFWIVPASLVLVACGRSDLVSPDDVPFGDRADAQGDVAQDTPGDGPDVMPGCMSNAQCAATPPTPVCDVASGRCVECVRSTDCAGGQSCVNFRCTSPCSGGAGCRPGQMCCGALCSDTTSDTDHCGRCDNPCPTVTNGTPFCASSACGVRCAPGFADCDRNPTSGCEVNLGNDSGNCGACGRVCASGQSCSGGVCVGSCRPTGCSAGQMCCGGSCANTVTDVRNCGACGNVCPPVENAIASCSASRCGIGLCNAGFGDCDRIAMNGCEATFASDPRNCGACGNACGVGERCSAGVCTRMCGAGGGCAAGQTCCSASCVNTAGDVNHCGGCGVACPPVANGAANCASGRCGVGSCNAGFGDCDRIAMNGCESNLASDVNNCGGCGISCGPGGSCAGGICMRPGCGIGPACGAGQTCCGGTCVNTQTSSLHCGGCGIACGAGATCVGGICRTGTCPIVPCGAGQTCCGGTCLNTTSDPTNCGACGVRCLMGQVCMTSACCDVTDGGPGVCSGMVCPGTQTNCGGMCFDTQIDPNHCGACFIRCGAGERCVAGRCMGMGCAGGPACAPGQTCCSTGCTNTASDVNNCGGCGVRCGAGTSCIGGTCTPSGCAGGPPCAAGLTCCATGCANVTVDVNNCGACGTACPAVPNATRSCIAARCGIGMCIAPFLNCDGNLRNGCEVDPRSDVNNCGGCGIGCGSGLACSSGVCTPVSTGSEGAFNPTVNPTILTPGVHNFTTITVPAGVMVRVAGTGPASGTLDLRATGHVQIDGIVDVSGGPGTQSIVASRSTQEGRAGTGGYTGEQVSSPMSAVQCPFIAGVGGINGPMVAGTAGTCRVASTTACTTRGDPASLIFASPAAQFGGGAGVFTGFRAYGSGGGGHAGGAPGALGPPFMGEMDCTGVTGGGGATSGNGGSAGIAVYNGANGTLGQTQCDGLRPGVSRAYVGGGGGGSIGLAAAGDLPASTTFYPGSGGGGGSCDYLQRPAYGGTSGGGGGGGVLRIWTPADIVINGQVRANGGRGGDAYLGTPAGAMCDPQPGAAGGGGSGGLIFLQAPTLRVNPGAVVSAVGGAGGDASVFATGGAGGAGGLGRVRVSASTAACTLAGSFNPPLVAGCNPTPVPTAGRAFVATYPN